MLAILAATAFQTQNGLALAHQAKVTLADFGITGPTRIQAVSFYKEAGIWTITLSDRSGKQFNATFDESTGLMSGVMEEARHDLSRALTTSMNPDPVVTTWIRNYVNKETTRFEGITTYRGNVGSATYRILRNGYQFLAPNNYAFSCVFTLPEHRFISYSAPAKVPPVDNRKPTITLENARGLAKVAFNKTLPAKSGASSKVNPQGILGYHLATGKKTAQLVWSLTVDPPLDRDSDFYGKHSIRMAVPVFVDAVTGEAMIRPY